MMMMMMRDHRGPPQPRCSALALGVKQQQQQNQVFNNATAVFSDQRSELTPNASGSRKRLWEESTAQPCPQSPALPPLFLCRNAEAKSSGVLPHSRLLESDAVYTSDQQASYSEAAVSPLARDLVPLLDQQSLDIGALVRLQTEGLRTGIEDTQKRHCWALLSVTEQQVAKRLMEKETELERARRRNADLETKVRQLSEENQLWFGMAKDNETMVCSLRASLEQALHRSTADTAEVGGREGYGDSDGSAADDVQSCCFEAEERGGLRRRRAACKACGEKEVCVLLLPCRHLCLCWDCESKADACPVCGSARNTCLHVSIC